MSHNRLFLISCCSMSFLLLHSTYASEWQGQASNNDWLTSSNWSAGIPGGTGNQDIVASFPTTYPASGSAVSLSSDVTLNTLNFGASYTISGPGVMTLGRGNNLPTFNGPSIGRVNLEVALKVDAFLFPVTITNANIDGGFSLHGRAQDDKPLVIMNGCILNVKNNDNFRSPDFQFTSSTLNMSGGVVTLTPITDATSILFDGSTMNVSGGELDICYPFQINNTQFTITGGTVTGVPVTRDNITSPGGTFSGMLTLNVSNNGVAEFPNGNFYGDVVATISGGSADFSGCIFNDNSELTCTISGGSLNLSGASLVTSAATISITNGANVSLGNFGLYGSIIQFPDEAPEPTGISSLYFSGFVSSFSIQSKDYSPSFKTIFTFSDTASLSFFSNGRINLENNQSSVLFEQYSSAGTYILFQGTQILNFNSSNFLLETGTPLLVLLGPDLVSNRTQVVVTASQVSPPPTKTIGASMMTRSLQKTQTTEKLKEFRLREGSVNQNLAVNVNKPEDRFLAQNSSFLAQATAVEQLGERAIERPSHAWSVYFAPTGSFGSVKTKQGQSGNDYYSTGFLTGFDWADSFSCHPERNFAFGIGSTFYYNHFHSTIDHHEGKTAIDQVYVDVYGTIIPKKLEELSLDFSVGMGYDWHQNQRVTGHFGSLKARSSTTGYEAGGFLGLEYLFSNVQFPKMGNVRFLPMALVQYSWISIHDYKEHGAGKFNLKVHSDSLRSLSSLLGARANYSFRTSDDLMIRPEITLGWQREYLFDDQRVSFSNFSDFNPQSASFTTIAPEPNTFVAGADIYVRMYDWMSLQMNYLMNHNDLITSHSFYLEWKAEF